MLSTLVLQRICSPRVSRCARHRLSQSMVLKRLSIVTFSLVGALSKLLPIMFAVSGLCIVFLGTLCLSLPTNHTQDRDLLFPRPNYSQCFTDQGSLAYLAKVKDCQKLLLSSELPKRSILGRSTTSYSCDIVWNLDTCRLGQNEPDDGFSGAF